MPISLEHVMSAALVSLTRDVPPPSRPLGAMLGEMMMFVCIGGAGALSFVVLSSVVIWMNTGLEAWVTNTACYAALILPVYGLQRRFSFRSSAGHRQALPRYMAVQGSALLLAALFSSLIHGVLAVPTVFASLLVIALTSGVNFVVLRNWAFASSERMVEA
jgi:putative flippase GtrA